MSAIGIYRRLSDTPRKSPAGFRSPHHTEWSPPAAIRTDWANRSVTGMLANAGQGHGKVCAACCGLQSVRSAHYVEMPRAIPTLRAVPTLIGRITLHRCAMQVAPKLLRTAVGQVNRASIVPENEVVILPAVAVNETRCRTMREEEFEQFPAFRASEVENTRREALVHEQRPAASFRMNTHDRMYDLAHFFFLVFGEGWPPFRSAEALIAVVIRMHRALSFDSLLDHGGQSIVGGVQIGK
jgi:hypothetical protein